MDNLRTVIVKPTIPAATQHAGNAADTHVLFDWTEIKGLERANKINGITTTVRGTDGADQTAVGIDLPFAVSDKDGTAPTTLGDLFAAVDTPGWQNNLIGFAQIAADDHIDGDLIYMTIASTSLEGKEVILSNPDRAKIYVAGIAKGAFAFSTGVVTSQAVDVSGLSAAQLVNADIEGTDPRLVFAPGDIVHAEDGVILGEVESMADANTIVFKADGSTTASNTDYVVPADLASWKIQNGAGAAGDLASGDELYNIHPIAFHFHVG
jgi:hypothetical protein